MDSRSVSFLNSTLDKQSQVPGQTMHMLVAKSATIKGVLVFRYEPSRFKSFFMFGTLNIIEDWNAHRHSCILHNTKMCEVPNFSLSYAKHFHNSCIYYLLYPKLGQHWKKLYKIGVKMVVKDI